MTHNHTELFFLLKQVDLQLTQLFDDKLNISLTRYEIMRLLDHKKAVTQTYLQRKLMINQAAITRHVKVLEEKDLLTRMRNPDNNREVLVTVTPEGQALLSQCELSKATMMQQLFDNYTGEDIDFVIDFLTTLKRSSRQMLDQEEE
ncbi:DNA-binding transcriptional regulator, MarR family [Halolactibacillus halophilus]|uniref:Transcriptional regulator n=1 Tax=Halolactibacillus halophilus TaxID=306540 RepID=A0A1I5Q612_9BACI|nr:MarR family transcriptional regulator [Halolactibacillus halophilus]GEM01617.1 transcriptional regulator [Halolactibacillus halophilus]SFP41652.1 DNA-binding transcriptional regulator, MarR family [Halolactibacillus halophilus]